jgi:hypothetical protein
MKKIGTKRFWRWIVAAAVLVALVALIARASSQTPMVPQASEAWSRGQIVGQTPVKRPAALQPAPDGGVFLVWQNMAGQLELSRIDGRGKVLLSHVLPVGEGEAGDPQLGLGSDGRLHLLWREGEHPHSTVWHALLDPDGIPVGQPQILSDPAVPVLDAPKLAPGRDGRQHAIWADDAGIRWAVLSGAGEIIKPPGVVASEGRFPAVGIDEKGYLHLVWHRQKRSHVESIYYLALDPDGGAVGEPAEIVEAVLRAGQRLEEPAVGLTPETCYVFWVVNDFKYVASEGGYATFPLGQPERKRVEPLQLRRGQNPVGLSALRETAEPLWVALSVSVPDTEVAGVLRSQAGVIALRQDGREEQIVTASVQASLDPTLAMDPARHLHMAWLESAEFGRYQVAYASTAPSVMRSYNALTAWDVVDAVFSNAFRLSMLVVTLVGVLIVWALVPLIGLLIYHLVTSEETLDTVRSRIAIVVALAVEVALTFFQPPRLGVEAAWPALQWLTPVVAAVVAAAVTASVVRRRKYVHLFAAFFLFTGVNSLLQMVVYLLA